MTGKIKSKFSLYDERKRAVQSVLKLYNMCLHGTYFIGSTFLPKYGRNVEFMHLKYYTPFLILTMITMILPSSFIYSFFLLINSQF